MQNHQTNTIAASASSSETKPRVQAKNGTTGKKSGATASDEQAMPVRICTCQTATILPLTYEQDNLESGGSEPTEGNMTWHMERWLNEKTGESAWSVHGRF